MCLAILAPKGTDKNSDFLLNAIRTAVITNDDGMGFAFKRHSTKKVYISKGFMGNSAEPLIRAIKSKKLGKNDELIVHLRIGNKGNINIDMCHPFVANKDMEIILSNDKYVNSPVFIHNGTLSKYAVHNSIYSDTYFFAKNFASNKYVMDMLKGDKDSFKTIMDAHIGTSRFVFLFPNEDTDAITLGSFIHDNGYMFSNDSYKSSAYRNVGGYSYPNYHNAHAPWDDYSDYSTSDQKTSVVKPIKDDKIEEAQAVSKSNTNGNKEVKLISDRSEGRKVSIPDDIATFAYTCPDTGEKFRLYRGLWIPPKKSVLDIRYQVNGLNYQKLSLKALNTDDTFEWKAGKIYDILDFDFREEDIALHTIIQHTNPIDTDNFITVPGYDLSNNFKAYPKFKFEEFFLKYLRFVANIKESEKTILMLTNVLKHLNHNKEVQFQDIGRFNREIFELYLYNYFTENNNTSNEEVQKQVLKVML